MEEKATIEHNAEKKKKYCETPSNTTMDVTNFPFDECTK